MHTSRHNPLRLRLIFIFILLIGFSINGYGDADPPVVTIIDRRSDRPYVPARSDAEILADKILERETEDFFFDIPQRNQLIVEIVRVLSLIHAAYPPMSAIHAEEESMPGMLIIDPERDFHKILKEMLQDKQGQIRFETGNAEFDALNAKLRMQKVRWGEDASKSLFLYFHRRLNLRVAIEAYSMVEGVREVWRNPPVEVSADIKAFKQGETWYVIFWNGWGDCAADCIYRELFCFTVTGTDVAMIPTAQAQTMPPFQELDPSLHNDTPFFNATAHTWSWWDSLISEGRVRRPGYGLGCSLFGEIEVFPNQLSVSCGYRMERLVREDRLIDNFDFTGVVLLLIATQKRTVIGNNDAHLTVVASKVVRIAKTVAEIEHPENVYFENVLMPINPPPPSAPFERWWGGVHPTFVVCWDHPETGRRAYQFLRPNIMHTSRDEVRNYPGCDNFRDTDYIQILKFSPADIGVRDDIDEVLPRPAASE